MTAEKTIARFMKKVRKDESGCWLWTAAKNNMGYGCFGLDGRVVLAHRMSYEIHVGPILATPEVKLRHACDTPLCVNPKHLTPGTQKENLQDMVRRGRAAAGDRNGSRTHPERQARGERMGSAKLTASQVGEILTLYAYRASQATLATKYGVSQSQISKIVRGKDWTHVG